MSGHGVSVIIPTLRRVSLLRRALHSVFAQTHAVREVVVVVDGPDPETEAALEQMRQPLLRVVRNERSLTAAGARNVGVAAASGEWIAFLDDDDEWHPRKLEQQLAFALASGADFITCASRVVAPEGTYIWPDRMYNPAEPLDVYLFDRRTLFVGAAFLQTSSYLIRRATYERAPFRLGTPHDDWDFVLRQVKGLGTRLETVPEPLVIHFLHYGRKSLSGAPGWRVSLGWVDEMRPLMTRRAYSGFCLCVVGPRAAGERAWHAFAPLLWKAARHGAPRARQLLLYVGFWTMPAWLRRWLRARRHATTPTASACQHPSPGLAAAGDRMNRSIGIDLAERMTACDE